jgi:prefoldin subunit 5
MTIKNNIYSKLKEDLAETIRVLDKQIEHYKNIKNNLLKYLEDLN